MPPRMPSERTGDAVLSINFVPHSREIRLVADAVQRSGAALVSIADSRITPLSDHARAILLFAAESPSFFPSITERSTGNATIMYCSLHRTTWRTARSMSSWIGSRRRSMPPCRRSNEPKFARELDTAPSVFVPRELPIGVTT